jgi:RNA polymerase sigma-70 factor (ECF subfamily)
MQHKSAAEITQELKEVEQAKLYPEKFAVLYDRYYKSIFLFVYRRINDEETTADIVSMVFLKAIVNIKKYEFKGVPFSAWLFRIAFNEINMYFRKNKADRFVSIEQTGIFNMIAEVKEDSSTEAQKRMMHALKQLRIEDLQLIELRFFESYSFAEVAAIVGITENNAKVKVYRILDKLKIIMTRNTKV